MTLPIPPWLRGATLLLAGLLALAIAAQEFRSLRSIDADRLDHSLARLQKHQPWGGLAGQTLIQQLHGRPALDLSSAEDALAWQLTRSPLNPWRWLDRAEFAHLRGADWPRVLWHLDAAVAIQPQSRRLRWRAAEISWQTGNHFVAEEHLRYWLQDHPEGTLRALHAASAWIADPESLIDRLLPEGEAFLAEALALARRDRRLDLAGPAWERLHRPRPPGDAILLDYVDLALAAGRHDLAAAAWAESHPDYRAGEVFNGDFSRELGSGRGLDWRRRLPAGVRVTRDTRQFRTEPASLRVDFLGSHNVSLGQLSLPIPVPGSAEPRRWRLTGYWRAEALTTRSLPYLQLAPATGDPGRIAAPGSSFGWTPFALEIDVPAEGTLLTLQVHRNALRVEFDRNISGTLWVDALRIESATAPEETP